MTINETHLSFCDKKIINNVNWTNYRLFSFVDLNPKLYRLKYIIGAKEKWL